MAVAVTAAGALWPVARFSAPLEGLRPSRAAGAAALEPVTTMCAASRPTAAWRPASAACAVMGASSWGRSRVCGAVPLARPVSVTGPKAIDCQGRPAARSAPAKASRKELAAA